MKHALLLLTLMATPVYAQTHSLTPPQASTPEAKPLPEAGKPATSWSLWGFIPGVHLSTGTLTVTTTHQDEIDKKGHLFDIGAYALRTEGSHAWHLGLGFEYATSRGSDGARGLEQEIAMLGLYIQAGWSYELGSQFFVGTYLHSVMGKGAWFDDGAERYDLALAVRPAVEYLWERPSFQTRFQLMYAVDVNNPRRSTRSLLLGASMTFESQEPEPPALSYIPTAPAPPVANPRTPPKTPVHIKQQASLRFFFQVNSNQLTRESKARLDRLINVLYRYKTSWERINIQSYTTAPQTNSAELAQQRSEVLRKALRDGGFTNKAIRLQVLSPDTTPTGMAGSTKDRVDLELAYVQGREYWEFEQALQSVP